jgi:hypothetical protein
MALTHGMFPEAVGADIDAKRNAFVSSTSCAASSRRAAGS